MWSLATILSFQVTLKSVELEALGIVNERKMNKFKYIKVFWKL